MTFPPSPFALSLSKGVGPKRQAWGKRCFDKLSTNGLIGLGLALALSACTVGPNYVKPAPPPVATGSFAETARTAAIAPTPLPDHWWQLYNRSEEHTSELQSHSDLVCPVLI